MDNRYYKQELLRRLQHLATQLESEGRPTAIIRDAIEYISKDSV